MSDIRASHMSRRQFLQTSIKTTAVAVVTTYAAGIQPCESTAELKLTKTGTTSLKPTSSCSTHGSTPPQTAGPFYTPNTPERVSLLEKGLTGTRLVLTGKVLTTACQPIGGALLDFWQTNDAGEYDNDGFRLRGHQFTDDNGHYRLETIIPGVYPGRTRHIHVRVRGPKTPLLTTQLYFPEEQLNRRDGIFHPALVVTLHKGESSGQNATFDFVLS